MTVSQVCLLFTSQYCIAMECVSVCLTICLGLSMGHCFLPFVISLSVCQFVSVSLIFYSAFLSVCLFVSVLLSDVYLTVYICQCFSSFVILSVCLFLCVRHFFCLTSFHLSVFFPFVTLTVCVCFSGARHVLCMTARPSISVSFHFSLCLSVCLFPLSVILCV